MTISSVHIVVRDAVDAGEHPFLYTRAGSRVLVCRIIILPTSPLTNTVQHYNIVQRLQTFTRRNGEDSAGSG